MLGDVTADEPFHTSWGPSGELPFSLAALLVIKHNSYLHAAPASRKTTGQEEKE